MGQVPTRRLIGSAVQKLVFGGDLIDCTVSYPGTGQSSNAPAVTALSSRRPAYLSGFITGRKSLRLGLRAGVLFVG